MKIKIYVALAKQEDEIMVLGVGTNSRLVEIQRDSFMMKKENINWTVQTQSLDIDVNWKVPRNVEFITCCAKCLSPIEAGKGDYIGKCPIHGENWRTKE